MNRSLSLEALAASQLMAALREQGEDDDEILATAVEGETGLLEAVDAALAELREIEIQHAGINKVIADLSARDDRLRAKCDRIKRQLLAAIEVAGVPTPLRRPCATVSVSRGRAKVVVTDEAALPYPFSTEKVVRVPNLGVIRAHLDAGEHIPGCTLSNACPTLVLRTR